MDLITGPQELRNSRSSSALHHRPPKDLLSFKVNECDLHIPNSPTKSPVSIDMAYIAPIHKPTSVRLALRCQLLSEEEESLVLAYEFPLSISP